MEQVDKTVGAADRFQRERPWLAFPFAVWKKFSDDQAANLAALISYYAISAIFPLLLILGTVLDIVLSGNPRLQQDLIGSALAQYPVIGDQIDHQLGSVSGSGGSSLALIFGILLLLFGCRGVAAAMQNAMCEIWGIRRSERPGFPMSFVHQFILLLVVGLGFVATTFLAGVVGNSGGLLTGVWAHIGTAAFSLILNIGMFWLAFRLASLRKVPWRDLRYGAIVAGIVWQILQLVGGYFVSHQLQRTSSLYGTFGVVLGLMAWVYLQAEVTLYAAEIDVVLVRRLWPRSIKSDGGVPSPRKPEPPSGPGRGTPAGKDKSGTKAA